MGMIETRKTAHRQTGISSTPRESTAVLALWSSFLSSYPRRSAVALFRHLFHEAAFMGSIP
jgi:hypothetical protein